MNQIALLPKDRETILIIDRDSEFVFHLKSVLEKQGYQVVYSFHAKEGIELFYSMKPSLVTLAINLADSNGLDVLKEIVTVAQTSFTPIVIMSREDTLENRIMAYSIGATDFISKPINTELFLPYVENRLQTKAFFEQSSTVDELTGALNRRSMERILKNLIATYLRYGNIFSIAMIDIDYFKKINDQFGHLEGDKVLIELVDTINSLKRDSDYLFRYGGEEFILLLPETNKEKSFELIKRIQKKFSNISFQVGEESFHVTFSTGITTIRRFNCDRDTLLAEVDEALYESKKRGRDCITC